MNPPSSETLKRTALGYGASACGVIPAGAVDSSFFERTVKSYPPSLSYLQKKSPERKDIRRWFPGAKAVLVCLYQYWHGSMEHGKFLSAIKDPAEHLKKTGRKFPSSLNLPAGGLISRYALSRDYHAVIKENLEKTLRKIKDGFEGAEGKVFADTAPVLEKELARLAGLGHTGKNTLLLNRELGSYVFIGGIALNFEAGPYDSAADGSCASCDKCLKACPTGALSEKGLSPLKCVSYWTTSAKSGEMPAVANGSGTCGASGAVPEEIRANSRGWIYGCDICQEVCPYNLKTRYSVMPELLPLPY